MGLGFEELRKTNQGLIYCSITGFGPDGPSSKRYLSSHSFHIALESAFQQLLYLVFIQVLLIFNVAEEDMT